MSVKVNISRATEKKEAVTGKTTILHESFEVINPTKKDLKMLKEKFNIEFPAKQSNKK